MKTHHDAQTLDLFDVPVARSPIAGALNIDFALRHQFNGSGRPLSLYEVAV